MKPKRAQSAKGGLGLFFICFSLLFPSVSRAESLVEQTKSGPSVLILFDGADREDNPGRLDALYLGNLLGHFTTRRRVMPLEQYTPGSWKHHDAVFCIVYEKHYKVPQAFLQDAPSINKPFCWLGNQGGQLKTGGTLSEHGVSFDRFYLNAPLNAVRYKGHTLTKGDPDTNIYSVVPNSGATVVAEATGPTALTAPYIIRSGDFWLVADSPFSYSSENDRMLAFADVLHDILHVRHAENHTAMIRLEDLNAFSDPDQLSAFESVLRRHHTPFSFGFVPMYVNPNERIYLHLSDKPAVVNALKDLIRAGGVPVLHGYTHQHRGITTDDYEFWDDIADRPVRRDSEAFAYRRLEEAVKESFETGIYPVTWETPHYAASDADYRAVRRIFNTTFERRQTEDRLGTDQYFPYPVIDLKGQYVIPESLGYIPQSDPRAQPLIDNAAAELVVRDGIACAFIHPFLNPHLLEDLLTGIENLGFKFIDLRSFPNRTTLGGRVVSTVSGPISIGGEGKYLKEEIYSRDGRLTRNHIREVQPSSVIDATVELGPDETYVAMRQNTREPGTWSKIWRAAKGDADAVGKTLGNVFPSHALQETLRAEVLWDPNATGALAHDQNSFLSVATNMGLDVDQRPYEDFDETHLDPYTLLIVPSAAATKLSELQVQQIQQALNEGLVLVTDGESALSKILEIELGTPYSVHHVSDPFLASQELRWPDRPQVPWVEEPSAEEDATVYYSERDLRRPLVIGSKYGQGRYLYFAPLFDPLSDRGYSRFPDLPFILLSEFRIRPLVRRNVADVYFDPGYRQKVSIETLAASWRRSGIRTVHAAAWHYYDKYSYDYERLIKVAHENGILVYAWFEWPHVSERFWNQHPAWRDKNALLADAHVDWRFLMNFDNPECFAAVMKDTEKTLQQYDWDGINIAELHYESATPEDKSRFTPFNNQARTAFQRLHGFDPVEIFREASPHFWKTDADGLKKFYAFRRFQNLNHLAAVMKKMKEINSGEREHREIILTMIDTLEHPHLADDLGIDLPGIVRLVNQYGVTLQAEDPAVDWSKAPDRYTELGERYKKLNLRKPFMIDINVLPVHPDDQRGFASSQPTGSELLDLWHTANNVAGRVCLYSESTIYESDWDVLPYSMAARATIDREGDGWNIKTPDTIYLDLEQKSRRWLLDDRPWLCFSKDTVIIPPGEHRLSLPRSANSFFDKSEIEMRLISLNGELLGSEPRKRGLEVEYNSARRCLLTFNKSPYRTYLDDETFKPTILKTADGFTVIAPPGQHRLRVLSGTAFFYFVQYVSVVSASLIVLFGTASSGMLVVLFILIKFKRRTSPIREKIQRGVTSRKKGKQ